jgi:uncharacterized membrane protein SpoIIM required for sporulation
MDLNSFLRDRRPRWQRLATLLDRIEAKTMASLTPQEADECFSLYRLTSSDLNLVQTRTANPGLVDFLEALVARAYAQLMVPREINLLGNYWLIIRHYFPAAIRAEWKLLALSTATLLVGILCGLAATLARPALAEVFLPAEHLEQSPRDRVIELEAMERGGSTRVNSINKNAQFTAFLFNNNVRVSVLAFGLGLSFGIGTAVMVFYNGAMLGSLAALYFMDGVGKFFIAWVGPHGVIELPCVLFAATAGFMLAQCQLRRDQGSTMVQIRAIRPRLLDLVIGCASLLLVAGTIEGGFSQINEPTLSYTFKIIVAFILFSLLIGYLFFLPARPRPVVTAEGEEEEMIKSAAAI